MQWLRHRRPLTMDRRQLAAASITAGNAHVSWVGDRGRGDPPVRPSSRMSSRGGSPAPQQTPGYSQAAQSAWTAAEIMHVDLCQRHVKMNRQMGHANLRPTLPRCQGDGRIDDCVGGWWRCFVLGRGLDHGATYHKTRVNAGRRKIPTISTCPVYLN